MSLKVSLPDKSAAPAKDLAEPDDVGTLLAMDAIQSRLRSADLFVAIGASGAVYPAAGFVAQAGALGIASDKGLSKLSP